MYKEDYCGIYKIENLVNGKVYIGQSRHIKQRWGSHLNELRRKIHHNDYLQKSWNKYGESNFSHEILELCLPEELNEREKYYISLYHSTDELYGYNLTLGGDNANVLISPLSKEKQRLALSGENSCMKKAVICLETEEVFITIKSAADKYNVNYSAITRCCQHKSNTCCKLHWMFYEDYLKATPDVIASIMLINPPIREKQVIYLNTGQIFKSIKDASDQLNINVNSVSQNCSGRRKTAGKDKNNNPRYFMYYDEYLQKQSEESVI